MSLYLGILRIPTTNYTIYDRVSLHGPAGTGKTSLSLALAGLFGLELYLLHVPSVEGDAELERHFSALPPQCFILLEEIDAVGINNRGRSNLIILTTTRKIMETTVTMMRVSQISAVPRLPYQVSSTSSTVLLRKKVASCS